MKSFANCLFGLLLFAGGLVNAGEEPAEAKQTAAKTPAGESAEAKTPVADQGVEMTAEKVEAAGKVENHALAAMPHADAAIEHGAKGHAEALVEHAQAALAHAETGKDNPHLAEAATHLQAAVEHGKMGHADVATQHAREAYNHIKAASRQ